jgi:hypothetical protein
MSKGWWLLDFSDTPPPIDAPPEGSLCHCGEPLRLVGFCSWCADLEAEQQRRENALAEYNRNQQLLDMDEVRRRTQAFVEGMKNVDGTELMRDAARRVQKAADYLIGERDMGRGEAKTQEQIDALLHGLYWIEKAVGR